LGSREWGVGNEGAEGAGGAGGEISNECPILLYERLRPKRSHAAGFTTSLSTSAPCPMPHAQFPILQ